MSENQPAPAGDEDARAKITLPVVGHGQEHHTTDVSTYWRRKLGALAAGDIVHVLLDDGRIVESTVRWLRLPISDRCCVWVHGITGSYAAGRVRTPGGWRRLEVKP